MSKNRQLLLLAGVTEFSALVTFGVRIRVFTWLFLIGPLTVSSVQFSSVVTCIPKIVVLGAVH